jgi:endonuclease/exonuclease/phosphatase family metal-dependent hydrolase
MWLKAVAIIASIFGVILLVRSLFFYTLNHYLHSYVAGEPSILFYPFQVLKKPKEERIPPISDILERGDILVRDYRDKTVKENTHRKFETKDAAKIRVVTLNIEMGKQIDKVITSLKELDPDIVFLQEVDFNTVRTGYVDIIGEIASELKMNSLFTVELVMPPEETRQYLPKKVAYDPNIIGYEGNAILSKFDFVEKKGLIVPCAKEKKHRRKTHNEAVVVCEVPNHGFVGCYCVHLDTYGSGVTGRVDQYYDILKDVKAQQKKYQGPNSTNQKPFYQIVGGDMNTLCHGLARFIPYTASDWYSALGRIGDCEATYFQTEAVEKGNEKFELNLRDPFDKVKDITFSSFKGLYQGKLDWLLMSENIETLDYKICPITKKCSDHQWVLVDIQLC